MTILGASMIVSNIAAARKHALDSISPFMLRREKHTQQNDYSAYPDYDDIPDMPEDYVIGSAQTVSEPASPPPPPPPPPPPQPYEKMRELADQVREILCEGSDKNNF